MVAWRVPGCACWGAAMHDVKHGLHLCAGMEGAYMVLVKGLLLRVRAIVR